MHGHGGRQRLRQEDGEDQSEKRRLSRQELFELLKPYFWPEQTGDRVRAFSCFVLLALSKLCNLVSPLFLGAATDHLARGEYDCVSTSIILFAVSRFLSKGFKELQNYVYLDVKQIAYREVAAKTFRHLHSLSLNWHLSKKTGRALRSMDRGIRSANTVVTYLFLSLGPTVVEWMITCLIFLTRYGAPWIALVAFVSFVVYIAVTLVLTSWRKKIRASMNEQDNDAHDKAVDSLTNFETVKYFTNEEFELKRYTESIRKYGKHVVRTYASLHILNSVQFFIIWAATVTVLLLVAVRVKDDEATVGDFVALNVYMGQLFQPLSFLGSIYGAVVDAFEDMRHLSELLAQQPDVADAPGAKALTVPDGPDGAPRAGGLGVEFRNVSFHYPTQNPERGLKNVSFVVPPGTTTAIVGHTGAGKSTISRLLFRFYDVNEGAVLIGGQNVEEVSQRSLRKAVGIVPQDTVLFNDTIAYNIRYGKTDADDLEIDRAAGHAQLRRFISRLDKGYESRVGERGLKLSGGEKQRVAIARTILKNPPVLVLDEATSALDSLTEQEIQKALARVSKGRTVVVIAHRLSTIRHADEILVMDGGVIVERGTHDALMELAGEYSRMWLRQTELDRSRAASDGSVGAVGGVDSKAVEIDDGSDEVEVAVGALGEGDGLGSSAVKVDIAPSNGRQHHSGHAHL